MKHIDHDSASPAPDAGGMTALVPMTEPQFLAFVEAAVPAYAAEKVAAGQWAEGEAVELSRKELAALLPQGLATPGNHLYTLRDRAADDAVGHLWIAEQQRGGRKVAYVYDVAIHPGHQRMGHATRAFEALEAEVRKLKLEAIALHVFGHNHGAQMLYAKLGYRPTNIHMVKEISPSKD